MINQVAKSNGFLSLMPGYKYKTGSLKHQSSTMKTIQSNHNKSTSGLKVYRAYDK